MVQPGGEAMTTAPHPAPGTDAELAACPHCTGRAFWRHVDHGSFLSSWFYQCADCGVRTRTCATLAEVIAAWNRRAPGPVTGIDTLIANTVRRVAEYDDRTSPDGWPEALLITPDELAHELREFASGLFAPGPDAAELAAVLKSLIVGMSGVSDAELRAMGTRDALTLEAEEILAARAAIAKFNGGPT